MLLRSSSTTCIQCSMAVGHTIYTTCLLLLQESLNAFAMQPMNGAGWFEGPCSG
jgi:hypothetical protein